MNYAQYVQILDLIAQLAKVPHHWQHGRRHGLNPIDEVSHGYVADFLLRVVQIVDEKSNARLFKVLSRLVAVLLVRIAGGYKTQANVWTQKLAVYSIVA